MSYDYYRHDDMNEVEMCNVKQKPVIQLFIIRDSYILIIQ